MLYSEVRQPPPKRLIGSLVGSSNSFFAYPRSAGSTTCVFAIEITMRQLSKATSGPMESIRALRDESSSLERCRNPLTEFVKHDISHNVCHNCRAHYYVRTRSGCYDPEISKRSYGPGHHDLYLKLLPRNTDSHPQGKKTRLVVDNYLVTLEE